MPNDEMYTPKWIFDKLQMVFDLDPCAPKEGPLHVPVKKWYSVENDGLSSNWEGTVWLNPPYSNPGPWVRKWIEHKDGLMIVPFSKAKWFLELWNSEAQGVFAEVNTKFIRPNGEQLQIWMPTGIWAIGQKNVTKLLSCNLGKLR